MILQIPESHKNAYKSLTREYAQHLEGLLGMKVRVSVTIYGGTVTMDTVMSLVAESFNISIADIKGSSRKREFVNARKCFSYLCIKLNIAVQKKIAEYLNVDHSTIYHQLNSVDDWIAVKDPVLKNHLYPLIKTITELNEQKENEHQAPEGDNGIDQHDHRGTTAA